MAKKPLSLLPKKKKSPSVAAKKKNHSISFSRRAFVIGGLKVGILGVLAGRLAWLQIVEGQKYATLAEENRINTKMIPPSRGEIIDRFGVPLAINNTDFQVLVLPEQTDDLEAALLKLRDYITLSDREIETVLEKAGRTAQFIPVEVQNNLSREDVSRIEVNLPVLPGILTNMGEIRAYPLAEAAAHVVGYVAAVSQADLQRDESPVLTLPGFRIGKSGIEKAYDRSLRGQPGKAEVEVNVLGREVRELSREDSRRGNRIQLSIDAELQRFTYERLSTEVSASAVIMDVHSGAVYALASVPSFDPNNFVGGISTEQWAELEANPAYPLTNKAISGQYPPGSTFKMITALAGMESGVITPDTVVRCPGHFDLGRDRFHCWKRGGHGWVDCRAALAQSCDTFFYETSLEIGIDKIAEVARRFGLDQRLDFDLGGEAKGLMPDKRWKRGRFDDVWHPGETLVASIGQGYILATPLQLAVMTARLVNGGKAVKPWVTLRAGDRERRAQNWPHLELNPRYAEVLNVGMQRVMEPAFDGTAAASQIENELFHLAGKTGTSQVRRITRAQRLAGIRNEELPWKDRHHALFVGYAPLSAPKYACAAVVEHGVSGSRAAAPIARDLLHEVQKRETGLEV